MGAQQRPGAFVEEHHRASPHPGQWRRPHKGSVGRDVNLTSLFFF